MTILDSIRLFVASYAIGYVFSEFWWIMRDEDE